MSRKCGIHLNQSPIVCKKEEENEDTNESKSNIFSTMETRLIKFVLDNRNHPGIDVCSTTVDQGKVEAFLDEHSEFLEDYIRRKVNKDKLEKWLFRRHPSTVTSPHNFLSPGPTMASAGARQRSQSFTPLRKLSATKFEEGGLATPILSKTFDGQPSFLRTQPPPSSSHLTMQFDPADECDRSKFDRRRTVDQKELMLQVLPDLLSATDIWTWTYKVSRLLRSVFDCDRIELFLVSPTSPLEGELYFYDELNDKMTKEKTSASRQSTATIMSRQVLLIERPDTDDKGFEADYTLVGPVVNSKSTNVLATINLYKLTKKIFDKDNSTSCHNIIVNGHESVPREKYSNDDRSLFKFFLDIASKSLQSVQNQQEMRLELSRSEVFLELARTIFREPSRLEPTLLTILTNFLSLIDCERCQILLSDSDHPGVFKRVFDLDRGDLNLDGSCDRETPFEARFPINADIAGEVASTGKTVNKRLVLSGNDTDTSVAKSIFCMPIRDPDDKVLGVISLINKEKDGEFTDNDARFVEAFSIFCGMAIRNAADYEKAVVSEAKLQVAFEVMNRFMTSTESDARKLTSESVPAASSFDLDSFNFNYLSMTDTETLTATIRMFIDLGLVSRFNIDHLTLCRFLLTVKRNYRNETVKYHNWYHAFNVAQMMFVIFNKTGWNRIFDETDVLGLLVACICHDLDHRGTNNSFQIKTKNPLAKLYSSSTMERHHLNQCLLLLNLKGNNIFSNLNRNEYSYTLSVIEKCILATDLSLHFEHVPQITELANQATTSLNLKKLIANDTSESSNNKFLLHSALMTAADLGAVTKPWEVHRKVSQLVAEEFWEQGDLERKELNEDPPPMMDRHASLSSVQVSFIDGVCIDIYQIMKTMNLALTPLLDNCKANRAMWEKLRREEQDKEAKKL